MELEAEQPAIPEVVHVGPQVGKDGRRRIRQIVEDLDQATFLGDEHAPVARELDGRRLRQSGEHGALLKARLQGLRTGP